MEKRVVVTGIGALTSLGSDWSSFEANLKGGVSGIRYMPDWERYKNMSTKLGGPVLDFETPAH